MVIFSPKKRSGIAVRVGERSGTWQAKRPTTHKYRVKEKQSGGAVFCNIENPNGLPPSHHIPTRTSASCLQERIRTGQGLRSLPTLHITVSVSVLPALSRQAVTVPGFVPVPSLSLPHPPLRGCFPSCYHDFSLSVPEPAVKYADIRCNVYPNALQINYLSIFLLYICGDNMSYQH